MDKILVVEDLKVYYPLFKGVFRTMYAQIKAVDGIDFSIEQGKTLGLVGESGCGKTTTGRGVLLLRRPAAGRICFLNQDLTQTHGENLRRLRRKMQIIFQDPYTSLDPSKTVASIISEPLKVHKVISDRYQLRDEVSALLDLVKLDPGMATRYPHEFSGGQRQRIAVARALALRPSLVVCDEPVSALDVSTQAQICELLVDLQEKLQLSYLFISHDLSVVRYVSDQVAVMYLGRIVEIGEAGEVCEHPQHPYTQALLSAVPIPNPHKEQQRQRITIGGEVPSAVNPPAGCRFHPRCREFRDGVCNVESPPFKEISAGHLVSCHIFA